MPVYRSPGDRATCQRNWPTPDFSLSSYDDVGTSYHINMKWWDQVTTGSFTARYREGMRRIKLASEFDPTGKFVWIHDQTSDVVANAGTSTFKYIGEFQDVNKSVHAYLAGHVLYNKVVPHALYDDVGPNAGTTNPTGHSVGRYTFIFVPPGIPLPPP
jgi:hypothetical protein